MALGGQEPPHIYVLGGSRDLLELDPCAKDSIMGTFPKWCSDRWAGPVPKPLAGSSPSTWRHKLLSPSLPMGRGPREGLFWELLSPEGGLVVASQSMDLGRLLGC